MDFEARLIADDGTEYPLGEVLTVGRSDDCDITLPSSKVSRQHARFRATGEGVTVEDLGSSNGTRLNGRAIGSAQALMDGDSVGIDTFTLRVVIATAAGHDDATVIAVPPDDDATVLAAVETASSSPAAATPPPAASEPTPSPEPQDSPGAEAVMPARDLPGSWVDSGTGESTQFLSPEAIAAARPSTAMQERHSPLAHFVVISADGSASDVFELETGDAEEDTWEIGRDDSCDIQLTDPTVSARHAQLVQRDGRWRMVNLISSNGIIVNDEKRLSVYLDDGDSVRLGEVSLLFRAPEGGVSKGAAAGPSATAATATKNRLPVIIGVVVAAAALVLAAVMLL